MVTDTMPLDMHSPGESPTSSAFVDDGPLASTELLPIAASSSESSFRPATVTKPPDAKLYDTRQKQDERLRAAMRLDMMRKGGDKLYRLNTFLLWLPMEVLMSLFVHTSLRPRCKNWQKHLDIDTTLRVCLLGGELGKVARRSVPALSVSHGRRVAHKKWGSLVRGEELDPREIAVHIKTGRDEEMFHELIKQVGRGLQSLALHFSYFWAHEIHFEEHCPNLTSLALYDSRTDFDLPAVLEACNGKMRSLEIGAALLPERYITAITKHCTGLEKLILKCGEIGASLLPMWEVVGKDTLKELTLGRPDPAEDGEATFLNYEGILTHCNVLRTFGVEDIGFGIVPISAIKGFGDQLETLRMMGSRSCLGPDELKMIFDDCPNAKVEAFVESNRVSTLRVLNRHLTSLKMKYDECEEGIEEVARECTQIEKFDVIMRPEFTNYLLLAFITEEMTQLRCLTIEVDGYYGLEKESELFNLLSKRVNTIQKLSCYVDYISVGVFSLFATRNKNIRSVTIVCGRKKRCRMSDMHYNDLRQKHNPQIEDAAVIFVEDFVKCEFLEELVLEDALLSNGSDRIRNVIKEYKIHNRSLDVCIGGIQYNS